MTSVVRSSSTQGESRELIRVQSWVGPKSVSCAIFTRPSRAASLLSALIGVLEVAEQDVDRARPSSGTLAAIFSLLGSKKWIAREGRAGISRSGSGAPTASGAKKSLALRDEPVMGRNLAAAARAIGMTNPTQEGLGI